MLHTERPDGATRKKKHVDLDGGINIATVQIRVRFLLLYFLMTDSIESVAQCVIEFHTAARLIFFHFQLRFSNPVFY